MLGGKFAWKRDLLEMFRPNWGPRVWHDGDRPLPTGQDKKKQLDVLKFDLPWLEDWIQNDPNASNIFEYRRLLLVLRAYERPCLGIAGSFDMLLLPTNGPYNILRRIARASRTRDEIAKRPPIYHQGVP